MDTQELADRLEIIEVCTRLHWCVDHRDWDGLDDLGLLKGLVTQHLIAGHQVELDGDRAVCRAHSINVHLPENAEADNSTVVLHGNEYRFELARTPAGWRIDGRQTWIRWRWGDEARYDVDRRLLEWSGHVRPAPSQPGP
jgi:hypothetical protein